MQIGLVTVGGKYHNQTSRLRELKVVYTTCGEVTMLGVW